MVMPLFLWGLCLYALPIIVPLPLSPPFPPVVFKSLSTLSAQRLGHLILNFLCFLVLLLRSLALTPGSSWLGSGSWFHFWLLAHPNFATGFWFTLSLASDSQLPENPAHGLCPCIRWPYLTAHILFPNIYNWNCAMIRHKFCYKWEKGFSPCFSNSTPCKVLEVPFSSIVPYHSSL